MMIRKLMSGNLPISIHSLPDLEHFAACFSKVVEPGDVIALTGNLGAGKTTLTRLLCQALNVPQNVTSPTFTLFNEYTSPRFQIWHGDFYRLCDAEIERLLPELEEQMAQESTVFILEWADKAPQLSYTWIWHVDFQLVPASDTRTLSISSKKQAPLDALQKGLAHDL